MTERTWRTLQKEAPIESYGALAALGVKAEVTGRKDVKGKECYEVTLTTKVGRVTRHYFDAKDFLKVREVSVKNTPRGPVEQVTDLMRLQGLRWHSAADRSRSRRSWVRRSFCTRRQVHGEYAAWRIRCS